MVIFTFEASITLSFLNSPFAKSTIFLLMESVALDTYSKIKDVGKVVL